MKASEKIKERIKEWEGLRLQSYRCPAGVFTIGYGHTGNDVKYSMVINAAKANELFEADLAKVEAQLRKLANSDGVTLAQHQWDALVSFTFNLGIGNLSGSTLWRKVRANVNDRTIGDEFRKWVYANKVRLQGLVNRREYEARWWNGQYKDKT